MAIPGNNSAWNDEFYANFVTDAEFAAYETSVSRQLCKLFQVPMNAGKVAQVPIWGQGTAQLIQDEDAATARNTTSTQALITLNEHVYFSQVSDMLRESAYGDVMSQLAEISGRAIGESLDTLAFSKFSSFSSDIGTTGTELTTEIILKAAATLRARKVMGPYFAVVHPNQAYYMKKTLTQTLPYSGAVSYGVNPSDVGNQVLVSGVIGSIGGVTIVESPLVAAGATTGGATTYVAGVFAPTALGIAERGGLNLQTLYLPQNRATDMSVVAVAGASVLQALHGVAITAEGTL
jgi:N4-gp56 family major capsid protein